jgi:precorrin-6x reductase
MSDDLLSIHPFAIQAREAAIKIAHPAIVLSVEIDRGDEPPADADRLVVPAFTPAAQAAFRFTLRSAIVLRF